MKRQTSYLEPFGWWGPVWTPPVARSLDELVAGCTLPDKLAHVLTTLVGRRASVVVAAGPSGAGKSTFLTALLEHLPPWTTRVYLRGCYEPFDFLDQTDPATTALLVNEISPHLPIYLWGPGVRRTLQAVADGYQLAATAHAESVEDFVYSLSAYPLRLSANLLRSIDLLILLGVKWHEGEPHRRVEEVVSLSTPSLTGTLQPERLAWRDDDSGELVIDEAPVARLLDRLERRITTPTRSVSFP
jgi:energy-coupling factor transporter ATP-binding protein EcfA2